MTTQQEINEEYERALPWIELWGALMKYGLEAFEADGRFTDKTTGKGIGLEHLEGLRTYFENKEAYGRAGRVHGLIQEHQTRWPNAKRQALDYPT
jgi:hypothetical protein